MATNAAGITPQANVVKNARANRGFITAQTHGQSGPGKIKIYNGGSSDPTTFTIAPGDLAFRLSDPSAARSMGGYTNTVNDLQVFTCFNNFPIVNSVDPKSGNFQNCAPQLAESCVQFVGVPTTLYNPAEDNQKDSLALVVGGSLTIRNNNARDQIIDVGDSVCWYLPSEKDSSTTSKHNVLMGNHVPADKTVAHTCSLQDLVKMRPGGVGSVGRGNSDIVEQWKKEGNMSLDEYMTRSFGGKTYHPPNCYGKTNDEGSLLRSLYSMRAKLSNFQAASNPTMADMAKLLDASKEIAEHSQQQVLSLRKHVIGIALSRAEPGEPLDILLRTTH